MTTGKERISGDPPVRGTTTMLIWYHDIIRQKRVATVVAEIEAESSLLAFPDVLRKG
jgi:hypothetical protein